MSRAFGGNTHPKARPTGRARLASHRAGQADPERLRRELSGADAGRMRQRTPVLLDEPCRRCRGRLGRRLQHRAAELGDRHHDARRLRRDPETATGIGATPPRKLRTDAIRRTYRRARAQFSTHNSSRRWMSDGGHFSHDLEDHRMSPRSISMQPSSSYRHALGQTSIRARGVF